MVTLSLLGASTPLGADTAVRDSARPPTVLAGLPGGDVDRRAGANPRVAQMPAARGPAPDAPGTHRQPGIATRIIADGVSYFGGSIVGAGVAIALGAAVGPILLLGLLAGVAAAKGMDNWLTTGSVFP